MVRHTGDYLLGTMFLAAALILQLSQSHLHSATSLRYKQGFTATAVSGDAELNGASGRISPSFQPSNVHPALKLVQTPKPPVNATPVNAVLTNLPRGSRIIVGSLDTSGARHQIRLTSSREKSSSHHSSNETSVAVSRFTLNSLRRIQSPTTIHSFSNQRRLQRNHRFVQTAAFESSHDGVFQPNITNAVYHRSIGPDSPANGHVQHRETPSAVATQRSARLFLLPQFRSGGTIHRPEECEAIGESQRVQVYMDQSLRPASSAEQLRAWTDVLVSAVELKSLPIVETWIGPICDVDRDQKLSVVITNLDHHEARSADRSPIFGCIRESDFSPESDLCGDIVYIDRKIFDLSSDEVAGLLTHEIAHAAICSIDHDVTSHQSGHLSDKTLVAVSSEKSIPPWLNEAIAHFMELKCSGDAGDDSDSTHQHITENFQRRIDAFLAGTSGSPIVASENVLNLEERRSGSRGAATLFLAPLISSPHDLRSLLQSDESLKVRIEDLAHDSFADVFRNWTLAIASSANDVQCLSVEKIASNEDVKHCSLLGTAFHCFECTDEIATLVLASDESAQLQVSVIEPAGRDGQLARSAAVTKH